MADWLCTTLLQGWSLVHFFYAFIRLLYFLLSWLMDISSIPGLYPVSESLTGIEDSTSTLWRDAVWGQCPKCAGSASLSQWAGGRTPASPNQEHGETEGEGKWKKKSDCPNARLEPQQVLSWGLLAWTVQLGAALLPACGLGFSPSALPAHVPSSLYVADLKFRCGWGELMAQRSLGAF